MKLLRILLPAVLPLAVMLGTTGCPHQKSTKVTVLPHPAVVQPPAQNPPNLDTKPFNPSDVNPTLRPYDSGRIDTSTNWDPANMNIDAAKLEAYTVHFKYDSAVVEDGGQANVASVAQQLKSDANARLLIAGHCDERGTEEYNRSLGERRALALREAIAKAGIDAGNIRTLSYGKDQPLDSGHDEAAWAKNRRGQFLWCTPKTPAQ